MIPRICIQATATAAELWEAEGYVLQLRWLGLVFEISIMKIVRRFDA